MHAVEFETTINNGFVQFPANYRKLQSALLKAKVIIMVEDEAVANADQKGSFDDLFNAPAGAFSSAQEIDNFICKERASWDK